MAMTIRLGLHRMSGRADHLFRDYVDRVRPNVVKFLDPGAGDEALAAWCVARGVQVIGRVFFDPQELGAGGGRQIADVLNAARACPSIRWWELHNEAWQADGDLARYAELSVDFMKRLDALGTGQKAVIGCFSVGMPDLPDADRWAQWRNFEPALRHAAAHGHAVGLHQYGGGSGGMRWEAPWYALRHRSVLAFAKAAGCPIPPLFITESGIDDLKRADKRTRGWQTMGEGYDYPADLAWFCRELSKDAQVLGVVDFGFAHVDPEWRNFDLAERPDVLARVATLQREIFAPTPAPKPQEPPMADVSTYLNRYLPGRWQDDRAALPDIVSPKYGKFGTRALTLIRDIAVHHTVGGKDQTTLELYNFHIGPKRVWSGLGYAFVIRRGRLHYVGDIATSRACVGDTNDSVVCVALTGDYTVQGLDLQDAECLRLTVAALQAWAADTLRRRLGVKGHKEFPGQQTACPGDALLPLVHELAAGAPVPAPAGPDRTTLVAAAKAAQLIRLNPQSALQKRMNADGFVPTSNELRSGNFALQLAEHLHDGRVRTYWCPVGQWAAVAYFDS